MQPAIEIIFSLLVGIVADGYSLSQLLNFIKFIIVFKNKNTTIILPPSHQTKDVFQIYSRYKIWKRLEFGVTVEIYNTMPHL